MLFIKGVLKDWYTSIALSDEYYKRLPLADQEKWKSMHDKNVSETVNDHLIEYIGKPIVKLLRSVITNWIIQLNEIQFSSS